MRQIKITESITSRDSHCLNKYMNDISALLPYGSEEEVLLARKIKEGDQQALSQLISHNLRFVISVAKQYQSSGLELADIIQEGNIGLMKAAIKYDETKGFKFISYAVWWIRQQIMQYLSEHSRSIHIPMNQVELINKINKATERFEQEKGYKPSAEELAEILKKPEYKIIDAMNLNKKIVSTDTPLGDDKDSGTLEDVLNADNDHTDESIEKEGLKKQLEIILHNLDKGKPNNSKHNEGIVLQKYFGIGHKQMSLEEIALEMNLTKERVRQIKENGLRALRRNQKCKRLLMAYMG